MRPLQKHQPKQADILIHISLDFPSLLGTLSCIPMDPFELAYPRLNKAQKQAVDTIYGSVVVIA